MSVNLGTSINHTLCSKDIRKATENTCCKTTTSYCHLLAILLFFNVTTASFLSDIWGTVDPSDHGGNPATTATTTTKVVTSFDTCELFSTVGHLFNQSVVDQVKRKHKHQLTKHHSIKVSLLQVLINVL